MCLCDQIAQFFSSCNLFFAGLCSIIQEEYVNNKKTEDPGIELTDFKEKYRKKLIIVVPSDQGSESSLTDDSPFSSPVSYVSDDWDLVI